MRRHLAGLFCFLFSIVPAGARCMAQPPNLVVNSSFECDGVQTSNLVFPITGWSAEQPRIGETSTFNSILVGHLEYLAICAAGTLGVVSQSIETVPGQDYTFAFTFGSDGAEGNFFQAKWDDQVVMQAAGMRFKPGWITFDGSVEYSFIVTASSRRTRISLEGKGNGRSCVGVDDVSVTPVNSHAANR
ncbi:MAG TPA: hypothetical protein VGR91_01960 [Stellaceae bacterium]|nr:hypothetical protein [Stellaceae bacterium]